ncbi:MAG: FAD-binding protein [Betaproteobacteria bacterium]
MALHEKNAPINYTQPETAMFATLTLPAGIDLTAPQRTPTVRVRSADDLRNALRHARGHAVKLDGSGMDRVLQLDARRRMVELQAATPWSELATYLALKKIEIGAFARMQGTVGEAVGQASAGPDGMPVVRHVAALTLFTPDGELRRADRNAHPELFRLAMGGHGVIGVFYSVTLSIDSLLAGASAATDPVELHIADGRAANAPECTIECLLPPASLEAYLKDVRLLADERRIALHGITVRRYQPETETALRWATGEWAGVEVRFGTKTTLGASVAAAETRRALLNAALGHGGSFPIRDLRDATRRQLEACYPMAAAFLADKRRSDPAERLQNAWYRKLATTMRSEGCTVRWAKAG